MGRGSPVCQQIREKIIEMFKINVPQRKIGRDLDISPSTVHNIIKRFKESGGISVRKGQGRKPKLNNRDLRSLRRHCIKNRHSSISDITTWAQDYFGKPLSSTTIRSYIHKFQLKLYFHDFTLTSNLIANSKHILACCPGGGLRARNMARTQRTPPYL